MAGCALGAPEMKFDDGIVTTAHNSLESAGIDRIHHDFLISAGMYERERD